MKMFLSLLLMTLSSFPLFAFDCNTLGELPILQNGRVRPLAVHAQETIKLITGKSKITVDQVEKNALELYCEESLLGLLRMKGGLTVKITHPRLINMIGEASHDKENYLLEAVAPMSFGLVSEVQKASGGYKKTVESLLSKLQSYQEVAEGKDWQVAALLDGKTVWLPISQLKGDETKPEELYQRLLKSKDDYQQVAGKRYLLELTYSKLHLTAVALALVTLAFLLTFITKKNLPIVALCLIAVAVQIAVFIFRGLIASRAPVTNMYESVYFAGLFALIFALIIGHLKKERLFLNAGLALNIATLLMAQFATEMISSQITPLAPVLRSNFWLSTHVSAVMLSYSAFGITFILANITLIKNRFCKTQIDLTNMVKMIYGTLIGGVAFLSLGIILGAIWADYSWGRFWGWDPKETWSLITLLIYVIILHGKTTSWLNPKRFIVATAAAFLSVMMAWFGVNFILASGMHSYGFSQGGTIFITLFFVIEIAILLATSLTLKKK